MLLYLYFIIVPRVLPQFISPNGHSSLGPQPADYDCFNDSVLLQDGPACHPHPAAPC